MDGWEEQQICRHVNSCKTHHMWEERKEREGAHQPTLDAMRSDKAAEEKDRLEWEGTRKSNLSADDVEFCKTTVGKFLSNGVPLNRLRGDLRGWLQEITDLHLQHPSDLTQYITELINEQDKTRRVELRDKMQSLVYDATPR